MPARSMVDGPNLTGELLDERFRLEARVGVGRFGEIFHGRDETRSMDCVVHVLHFPSDLAEGESSRLKLREALRLWGRIAPRSTARGIARLFGFALPDRAAGAVSYVASEWIEGETLELELLQRRSSGLTGRGAKEIVELLDPMVEALATVHSAGGVHGSLHPRAVRLTSVGRGYEARLIDVGTETALRSGATRFDVQTDIYQAPEQLSPILGETSPRTDVYALAILVLELLADRAPLQAATTAELGSVVLDPLGRPTPAVLGIELGPIASDVLARATSLEPTARFDDAGIFWGTFKAALQRDVTRSVPPPRSRSSAPPPPPPSETETSSLKLPQHDAPPPSMRLQPARNDAFDTVLTEQLTSARSLEILANAPPSEASLPNFDTLPIGEPSPFLLTPKPQQAVPLPNFNTPLPTSAQVATVPRHDSRGLRVIDPSPDAGRIPMFIGIAVGVVIGLLLLGRVLFDSPKPVALVDAAEAPAASADVATAAAMPDAYAFERALAALDPRLPNCKQAVGPTGVGSLRATFDQTGTVTDITLDPPYAGTSRGGCITGLFRTAHGPSYKGPAHETPHKFYVAP